MFAGQTNGPEQGGGRCETWAPPWHLPHAGWLSTQQCWFIPSSAGTPEIYLVFVSPSIHVACLCAAVTFGLLEDE